MTGWSDDRRKRHWIVKCSVCHRLIGFDMATVKYKDCVLDFASDDGIYVNQRHMSDIQNRHHERHSHLKEADDLYPEEFFRQSRIMVNYETNKKTRS